MENTWTWHRSLSIWVRDLDLVSCKFRCHIEGNQCGCSPGGSCWYLYWLPPMRMGEIRQESLPENMKNFSEKISKVLQCSMLNSSNLNVIIHHYLDVCIDLKQKLSWKYSVESASMVNSEFLTPAEDPSTGFGTKKLNQNYLKCIWNAVNSEYWFLPFFNFRSIWNIQEKLFIQ